MSDENEYEQRTIESLLLNALENRDSTAKLLEEAQRRDVVDRQELAAVVGKTVGAEWTPAGAIALDDGVYQIAICIRLTPVQESLRLVVPMSMPTEEPTRPGGGTWRDQGRAVG